MATPIGHSLAGLAVYSTAPNTDRPSRLHLMLLCMALAVFPDLDLLPGLLQGQPVLYHGSISHSLGFAVGVSLVIALIYRFQGRAFVPIFKLCLMAYVSHLVLDFFGPDGRAPYGIPLFWPLSSAHFLSPIPLLLGARHVGSTTASTMAFLRGVLSFYNVAAMTLEIVMVVPFIWLGQRFRRANREDRMAEAVIRKE